MKYDFDDDFTDLDPGKSVTFVNKFEAELEDPDIAETIFWTATVEINEEMVDEATATTVVKPLQKEDEEE